MGANDTQVGGTHYKGEGVQHWDWVSDNNIGYLAGNATKYIVRHRKKNGLQDLEKARHYVVKMIEKMDEGKLTDSWTGEGAFLADLAQSLDLDLNELHLCHDIAVTQTRESLNRALHTLDVMIRGWKSNEATPKL